MLVALLLLLVFTLRTTVVSIFSSISRPLVVTIMTYCHEEQESRYHHFRIVGHDSRVVDEYHADNYHKRSADAGEYGYYSGPKCEDKKEQECHKHP